MKMHVFMASSMWYDHTFTERKGLKWLQKDKKKNLTFSISQKEKKKKNHLGIQKQTNDKDKQTETKNFLDFFFFNLKEILLWDLW